jgi:hypothetical protein
MSREPLFHNFAHPNEPKRIKRNLFYLFLGKMSLFTLFFVTMLLRGWYVYPLCLPPQFTEHGCL